MKPQPGDIQALKSSLHTEPTLEGNLFYLYEIISPFQKHLARVKQPFIASWFPRSFFKNQKQAPSPNPGTAKPEKTNGHSLRQGLWLQLELGLKGAGNPKVGRTMQGPICPSCFPCLAQQQEQGPQASLPTHCLHPLTASWLVGRAHSD